MFPRRQLWRQKQGEKRKVLGVLKPVWDLSFLVFRVYFVDYAEWEKEKPGQHQKQGWYIYVKIAVINGRILE